jgi:hypothetical protein
MAILQGRAYVGLGRFDEARKIIAEFAARGASLDARAAARVHTLLDLAIAGADMLAQGETNDDPN